MFLEELPVGTQVDVNVERKEKTYVFNLQVEDRYGEGIITQRPSINGEEFIFHPEDKIFLTANVNSLIFRWDCDHYKIVDMKTHSHLILQANLRGIPINRRQAYRVELNVPARIYSHGLDHSADAIVNDLSLTGIGLSSDLELNLHDHIDIYFICNDHEKKQWDIKISAEIVRKIESWRRKEPHYSYGAAIRMKSNNLAEFLLLKQLEAVRKEKSQSVH